MPPTMKLIRATFSILLIIVPGALMVIKVDELIIIASLLSLGLANIAVSFWE